MTVVSDERLNHLLILVPPASFDALEACLDHVMPWSKITRSEGAAGYTFAPVDESVPDDDARSPVRRRVTLSMARGALYFRASPLAERWVATLARLRDEDAEFGNVLTAMEGTTEHPETTPHVGFLVPSRAEWERRLAGFAKAQLEHPEWQLEIRGANRPGDPTSICDRIYQAWLRIGLLGPMQDTFEMQCLNPDVFDA